MQVEILVWVLLAALASEAISHYMVYRHEKYKDTLAKVIRTQCALALSLSFYDHQHRSYLLSVAEILCAS